VSAWALPWAVHLFLRRRLSRDAVILELGSGEGTALLVEMFREVYTVEHDEQWLGKVDDAIYIHAPIVDGWYSRSALEAGLPKSCDCIIVDGPPGAIGRWGLTKHLDLFGRVPLVVDDVHRGPELELALHLAREWDSDISLHRLRDGRAFATSGWGDL